MGDFKSDQKIITSKQRKASKDPLFWLSFKSDQKTTKVKKSLLFYWFQKCTETFKKPRPVVLPVSKVTKKLGPAEVKKKSSATCIGDRRATGHPSHKCYGALHKPT